MFTTMDHREITSHSNTLDEAIRSARNAWWNGGDDRLFTVLDSAGATVARVERAQVTPAAPAA